MSFLIAFHNFTLTEVKKKKKQKRSETLKAKRMCFFPYRFHTKIKLAGEQIIIVWSLKKSYYVRLAQLKTYKLPKLISKVFFFLFFIDLFFLFYFFYKLSRICRLFVANLVESLEERGAAKRWRTTTQHRSAKFWSSTPVPLRWLSQSIPRA